MEMMRSALDEVGPGRVNEGEWRWMRRKLEEKFVYDRRAVTKEFDIVLWSGVEWNCEVAF